MGVYGVKESLRIALGDVGFGEDDLVLWIRFGSGNEIHE